MSKNLSENNNNFRERMSTMASVFSAVSIQETRSVNHFKKLCQEINIDLEKCSTTRDVVQSVIIGHFKRLNSRVNADLGNLSYQSSEDSSNSSNLEEILNKYKDNPELYDLFKRMNDDMQKVIDDFTKESAECIKKTILANRPGLKEEGDQEQEQKEESAPDVESETSEKSACSSGQDAENYRMILSNLAIQEKNLISNLDEIANDQKVKDLIEKELEQLKQEANSLPNDNAEIFNFEFKFRNLLNRIKFKIFSNNVCEYRSADEAYPKPGYLFKSSLIDFDDYKMINLYDHFKVDSQIDSSEDTFFFEQLNSESEYLVFHSNKRFLKSSVLLYSQKDDSEKAAEFKLDFESEFIIQIDKLHELNNSDRPYDFILLVTKSYFDTQFLHFINISNQNNIFEDLNLKREISSAYKYLCFFGTVLYFFDIESQSIKGYVVRNNKFEFTVTTDITCIGYDELIEVKQFIRKNDRCFVRIETDEDHSDYIYVLLIDENNKITKVLNRMYFWGTFKISMNFLLVLEGDLIRRYQYDNTEAPKQESQIVRSNDKYSSLSEDMRFISKDAKTLKFIIGSRIYI